jgi:high-affinity iron transporter
MLPTFVIGLREGLEAALIVSIIATFLRRNGASLRPMWFGVCSAVLLSIGVGVALDLVERSLPQQQQEGMETVIGLVAVVFVTAMVLWMSTHARFLKRDLEGAASSALTDGTSWALVAMAFLAVLREGFESAVFLLATFQASTSTASAVVGAVLGILTAVALGYGIFAGGVRLNLGRFFSITNAFLILVAAGLVLSAFRTAHEAGWLTIGQGRTVDLSWLAPTGSVRAALVSGVLGIPADPRVIEVVAWAAYLVPMVILVFWPRRWRPAPDVMPTVRLGLAALLAAVALVLVVAVPIPHAQVPTAAPLTGGGIVRVSVDGDRAALDVRGPDGRAQTLALAPATSTTPAADAGIHDWTAADTGGASGLPESLTLTQLLRYTGQRIPVGLDIHRTPGPFRATWAQRATTTAQTYDDGVVTAAHQGGLVLTLRGGGLTSERVLSVTDPQAAGSWRVPASYTARVEASIADTAQVAGDRKLWKLWFPLYLVALAVWLGVTGWRRRAAARAASTSDSPGGESTPDPKAAGAASSGRKHHVST